MTRSVWVRRRRRRNRRRRWALSSIENERLMRAAVGDHRCMRFWAR